MKAMITTKRADVIAGLQQEILKLQGFKTAENTGINLGVALMNDAFPNASFPLGCVHELVYHTIEDAAVTSAFVAGILSFMMHDRGAVMWIGTSRKLFPPALKNFGIDPCRVIFIDVQKEKHVLWAMEEALKCGALTAVIGEVRDISFTASQRLQLAVEQSRLTGFLLNSARKSIPTACVSRWKISSLASASMNGMPGIGFPKWRVELLRIRNGRPGAWDVQWINGKFHHAHVLSTSTEVKSAYYTSTEEYQKQAG